jgi:hypothetical protein
LISFNQEKRMGRTVFSANGCVKEILTPPVLCYNDLQIAKLFRF